MKHLLPIFCLLMVFAVAAKQQRTGPSRLKPIPQTTAVYDTIFAADNLLTFSGYDKPNSATKETFFVSNVDSDSTEIAGFNITLTYRDLSGQMLHQARKTVMLTIPGGQTRSVSIPSWDANHAFHYHRSAAPTRKASSPFRVSIRLNYVLVGL